MSNNDPLLQLYCDGDRIGAPAEGVAGVAIGFAEVMCRQHEYPNGTDESDLVRCFARFADGYAWAGDYEGFAVKWSRFIAHHHAYTSYGRTWRDHFATVRALERAGSLTFDNLLRISRDRNSAGNGCLALAYPAWHYARAVAADPYRLARAVTEVSHAHPVAQRCVAALIEYFECGDLNVITAECFPPAGNESLFTHLAPGCLWAALECARATTKDDAIRRALEIGGDVDSYLSLGLLLWGFGR